MKNFHLKEESYEVIKKRILDLCEPGDYGFISPPLDPQKALDELIRFFLGKDWYCFGPTVSQGNTEAIFEIESRLNKFRYDE